MSQRPAETIKDPANRRNGNRIGYLDTYRGIACLMVYFYHSAVNISMLGTPLPGYYGVHLFFVLSGYLIVGKFIPILTEGRQKPDIKKYLARRILRIYPPYLVCLAIFVILRMIGHVNAIQWQNVFYHAALIFNYVDKYDYFSINVVFWSLAVEAQFYVVLPLAVCLVLQLFPTNGKRIVWLAILCIVVGILSRIFESSYINHDAPNILAHIRFKWITSYLDLFGVGILLRAIEWKAGRCKLRLNRVAASGGLALGITILYSVALWSRNAGAWQEAKDFWFLAFDPPLACLGFACLLAGTSLSDLRESALFRWVFPQWVGLISYSFYLYHVGVLFVFGRIFQPLSWGLSWNVATLLTGLICLPLTLFVAWASYNIVEKPFLKMG